MKQKNNCLPEHLENTIPQMIGEQNNFNFRNNYIPIPKSWENYFLKFIRPTMKVWNNTRINVGRVVSLQSLKSKLSAGLNAHRKKYNFIPSSTCLYCIYRLEE